MLYGIKAWTFERGQSQLDKAQSIPKQVSTFQSPFHTVKHLADNFGELDAMGSLFSFALHKEHTVKSLPKPDRKITPNLIKYVDADFGVYQNAATQMATGNASDKEMDLACALQQEIADHGVMLSRGQVLFHGEEDVPLKTTRHHARFISTSLSPSVAAIHATRSTSNRKNIKKVVYVLTLTDSIRALWHHDPHSSGEYEFLLPFGLAIDITNRYQGIDMDVVEATVSADI